MPNIKKWVLKALSILSYAVIFGGAGFYFGASYSFKTFFANAQSIFHGESYIHAQTLAELRQGNVSKAIRTHETLLDSGIISAMLPVANGQQKFENLSDLSKRAMYAAKIYRTAYPPDAQHAMPELITALNQIPIPDKWTSQCDSALCKLYSQIQSGAATQPTTSH